MGAAWVRVRVRIRVRVRVRVERMRAACRRHVAALVRAIAQVPHLVRVRGSARGKVRVRFR